MEHLVSFLSSCGLATPVRLVNRYKFGAARLLLIARNLLRLPPSTPRWTRVLALITIWIYGFV